MSVEAALALWALGSVAFAVSTLPSVAEDRMMPWSVWFAFTAFWPVILPIFVVGMSIIGAVKIARLLIEKFAEALV